MLDKFQKLFGPNETASTDDSDAGSIYTISSNAAAQKTSHKASFRRRVFGFVAFVLLLCAVLPWVFEPAEDFAKRGAVTEIPKQGKTPYSQRMAVTSTKNTAKKTDAPKAEVVARNLSQANPTPSVAKKGTSTVEKKTTPATKPTTDAHKTVDEKKVGKGSQEASLRTKATTSSATDKATQSSTLYYIQLLATSNKASANEHANRISKLGLPTYVEKTKRHQSDIWRVRVGKFDSITKAKEALDRLALNSITNGGIMTEKPTKK